jgi:hypothetical protein
MLLAVELLLLISFGPSLMPMRCVVVLVSNSQLQLGHYRVNDSVLLEFSDQVVLVQ